MKSRGLCRGFPFLKETMNRPKYKVGDRVLVKLSGGRIVEATIKAIIETTNGVRLQVSFGDATARFYEWQIVIEAR
jgi:small nuclear ribonucleoprotein (snRNP)-like protein